MHGPVVANQPHFKIRLSCETNRTRIRLPLNTSLIAYAGMENQLKVAVELHEGEKSTKKIWRFNVHLAAEYTL